MMGDLWPRAKRSQQRVSLALFCSATAAALLVIISATASVHALQQLPRVSLSTTNNINNNNNRNNNNNARTISSLSRSSFLIGTTTACVSALIVPRQLAAYADEIGVEQDAPTFGTGETVEICTKRGPLGACLKTELRTEQNDNDKASKYFGKKSIPIPTEPALSKGMMMTLEDDNNSNALIQKLRQQSIDNKERNDLAVERKTFENNQSANFGPFDRKVLVMNTDGRTFTLLENPIAMRLKQAGFIDSRRVFIKQPTAEDMAQAEQDAAAAAASGGLFQALFGGGSSE